MMAKTLQDLINGTPQGGTLDLKAATYPIGGPTVDSLYATFVADTKPVTITGEGAHIVLQPGVHHQRALMVRGPNVKLLGDVTVHGAGPDVANYSYSHEFGHAIELQGALNFESTWKVTNAWGNGYFLTTRRMNGTAPDRWCKGVKIHDYTSAHCGRQHIAVDAADDWEAWNFDWKDAAQPRAAIDIEPPGSAWGFHRGHVHHGTAEGFDFFLANGGNGNTGGCADLEIDHVDVKGQYFGVRVVPPADTRRQNYNIHDVSSDTKANHAAMTFWNMDGVTLHNVKQPMAGGVELARFNHCTGIVTDPGVPIVTG